MFSTSGINRESPGRTRNDRRGTGINRDGGVTVYRVSAGFCRGSTGALPATTGAMPGRCRLSPGLKRGTTGDKRDSAGTSPG
ncbi:hypothetical protein DPMN_097448 [Dreissena polymorpha]|uniref:Uncharacterized protein n=1 Tax=Dreissena polymorpha TaxID=45954 RepID=A0A9D4LBR0_DREPO|nr:hypothetical protein DPMN_097448 [Dreissena polymorpha]